MKRIGISVKDLDTHRNIFNCLNKTIIFNDIGFDIIEHTPEHLITKMSNFVYDPGAKAPEFLKFLETAYSGDHGLISYTLKYLASAISGLSEDSIDRKSTRLNSSH